MKPIQLERRKDWVWRHGRDDNSGERGDRQGGDAGHDGAASCINIHQAAPLSILKMSLRIERVRPT